MTNRGQRGFVLLAVVLAMTVLAVIAFVLSHQGASQVNTAAGEVQRDQLRYVTEAGLQHAKWQLAQNSSCTTYANLPATPFGLHSYSATIAPTSGSPVSVASQGTLVNGAQHTLQSDQVSVYEASSVLTLQPDTTAGEDTYIYEWKSAWNYGTAATLRVENKIAGDWSNALLKFDLSSIPASAKIISATLVLNQSSPAALGGDFSIHRVTNPWVEGVMTGGNGSPNWTNRDIGVTWATLGGDYDPAAVTTINIPVGLLPHQWEVAALVQSWVSGDSLNFGMAIVPVSFGSDAFFHSSDASNAALRPKLTITYACECGKICGSGGSAGKLLLVVGNAASPASKDSDRKTLIESWGYTVTLIDDGDSQANFDAALAINDVAFVTEGSDPGAIGSKLTDTTTGVVNEEETLLVELGFTGDTDSNSRSEIVILDNTHYITSDLALGTTTITTSNQPLSFTNNGSAPGAQILAETNQVGSFFEPSLLTLETSAELFGGGFAAGRRVALPWGASNFDINSLNANGLTIIQRAIEWAAGTAAGVGPKKVLFVVGNDGGLTTEELAHQAQLEDWGHTVELIDDDASQTEFNTAAANNDVTYATNDITASRLGTKLVDATIGVVTSEDNLSDEFGMASSIGWDSGTVVEINDNTHYITSPFATGLLTVFSGSESLAYVSGTLSPDLGQLASSSSGYGIVTLDAGAAMYAGGNAAGRRVQLPWGGSPALEPNDLTPDGLTILQRALEWGAGAGPSPPAPGYFDQFNTSTCNAAIDYAGSDGAVDWSPWAWTEVDELDGSCAGQIRVAPDPDIDDSGSFRLRVAGQGVRVYRTVDLTGFSQPTLSFDYRLTDYPALDFMRIRVFDGVGYNEIGRFTGPFDQTAYQSASFDLSAYAGLEIQVQFEFNGTSTTRTSYIDNVHVQEAGSGGGGGGGGDVTFEEFADASLGIDGLSITIPKPAGTAAGDLLIATVVTDAEQKPAMTAPSGWTLIDHGRTSKQVTMDVSWKIADASEPGSYDFSWVKSQQAHGWIMRFTGHNPAAPIHNSQSGGGTSSSPVSPAVTTTIANTMIVRIGGFDDDDISAGDPRLVRPHRYHDGSKQHRRWHRVGRGRLHIAERHRQ